MTCIIAWANGKQSLIAADKLGSNGHKKDVFVEPKIFKKEFTTIKPNGKNIYKEVKDTLLMGYTTSFRMGQLLKYSLSLPKCNREDFMEYLVLDVVPELRKLFKDQWDAPENNMSGGNFLIVHNHKIYEIQSNFSVGQSTNNYASVGSGLEVAIGCLSVLDKMNFVKSNIDFIFKTVSEHIVSVSEEFDILEEKS